LSCGLLGLEFVCIGWMDGMNELVDGIERTRLARLYTII
jgi:hypothetical protein